MDLVKPPEILKKFARICKIAHDYETADPIITYYCRLYVASMGLKPEFKSKESRDFVAKLLDYLAQAKSANAGDPLYTEEKLGLEYLERHASEIFTAAFKRDEAGDFSAATVTAFVNSGYLLEVLTLNGETSEELTNARKYAKFKAVHIIDCKKRGVQPTAGPLTEGDASAAPKLLGLSQPTPPNPAANTTPSHPPSASQVTPSSPVGATTSELSAAACDKAIKSAKYAISSLQYKDRDSAMRFLQEALAALAST